MQSIDQYTQKWKLRSARVQVREDDLPSSLPPQNGLAFNIWYNKWSQGHSNNIRFLNLHRLDPKNDSGLTVGDKVGELYFCLYFSKGMCCLGKMCRYLHHLPEEEDISRLSMKSCMHDCFGREKYSNYREDMGGVGSFKKQNRTLYIGGILGALNNKISKPAQIESRIRFVFGKLGSVDRIKYVESKNCAFVKFKHQVSAEFAKECMSNQKLLTPSDKEWDERKTGTGLLVKWANDDPNLAACKLEKQEQNETMMKMMVKILEEHDSEIKRRGSGEVQAEDSAALNCSQDIISSDLLNRLKKRKTASSTSSATFTPTKLVDYTSSDDDVD